MRTAFIIFLFFHGLVHLMGFLKAFGFAKFPQLSQNISNLMGGLWLVATVLFFTAAILFRLKNNFWIIIGTGAVILSQVLIVINWQDAKVGTLANLVIFMILIVSASSFKFENKFQKDVSESLTSQIISEATITERDIQNLPVPVQGYLKYVGILGKPKVKNAKAIFKGKMRERGKNWFGFTSEQYNFFEDPKRFFFMEAKFRGLPIKGYHRYKNNEASMNIKLFSLFSVVNLKEPELFPTETVTFFNDLCLFAPSALIDENIHWQPIDAFSAKAFFTNKGVTISATLYFNEKGQLVNFVSEDRVDVNTHRKVPFSTPIKKYGIINGYKLPIVADATWHFPEGDFVYGQFYLQNVEYNLTVLK